MDRQEKPYGHAPYTSPPLSANPQVESFDSITRGVLVPDAWSED
jgi:hypothetical protein